ncbi:MAG: S9 family peptidase [Prevotella sp.]|nr:S9 family peptidase [Prevotella sp.]
MKKSIFAVILALISASAMAKDIKIERFRYAGPYEMRAPLMLDSVSLDSKQFKTESLLETPLKLDLVKSAKVVEDTVFSHSATPSLHLLGFQVQNSAFAKTKISVKGLKNYHLYLDGSKIGGGETQLQPGTHEFVVKFLTEKAGSDTVRVKISTDADLTADAVTGKRLLTLNDLYDGLRIGGLSLSPDGRYAITSYTETLSTGKSSTRYRVTDTKTGGIVGESEKAISWMPRSNRYYYTQPSEGGRRIVTVEPATGAVSTLATGLSDDAFRISPTEKFLILTHKNDGPKGDKDVHQYVEPDDRQPGWRNRNSLIYYDLATGIAQPLTYGHHDASLLDISDDGRHVLLITSKSRLTERPTTLYSILRLDLQTMKADTIVKDDGFIASAKFSPDGKTLAVKGSPEAFGSIGKNVPTGRTPSMYDYQLYLVDVATRKATPLTRSFNPSIDDFQWSRADGKLYFTANDRDKINFFSADAKTLKINQIETSEDCVRRFSLAKTQPLAAWTGVSASNSARSYLTNLKTQKSTLVEDQHARLYGDIALGDCKDWDFVGSRGDTICARYYLPPSFDAAKKYPMLVYYYGGCSPTPRYFESGYAPHLYAAQGYVVFVVNPSGAAGFGQEYASRHVNTAGDFVADDIIEGTKCFAEDHPFIDSKHIGCLGASYGGFMTQYLQTKTDIFAAAMSHAGISDHTSYWGEGYWGYSYSEVAMANSYPWSHKELYVEHSPLYNADKIHTPILFLHGTADTNVPVGESIQMYTALKLLGRETAFVVVEGENHWILDYKKRQKWQNTTFAWFQKWLKGDATWWDTLYPEKNL